MKYTRTRAVLQIVDTCELMTHLVNHCFGDVLYRAVKVLSAQIKFVYAFVVFAFFPKLLFQPPTVCLIPRIDLNRNDRFHKFAAKQAFVDKVVKFSKISDRFDISFRSVFQFSLSFVKKCTEVDISTFDTRVKLYNSLL